MKIPLPCLKEHTEIMNDGYNPLKESVMKFGEDLDKLFDKNKFVVFVCGPSLTDDTNPGAALRQKIIEKLKGEGFEVVLGEDDGLENIRKDYDGYAHDNELKFIQQHCNAVVLIAASVGSFCELGLFAHSHVHQEGNATDFILILNKEFEKQVSYLSEGPAAAMEDFGKVFYANFSDFDETALLTRLKRRRSVFSLKIK